MCIFWVSVDRRCWTAYRQLAGPRVSPRGHKEFGPLNPLWCQLKHEGIDACIPRGTAVRKIGVRLHEPRCVSSAVQNGDRHQLFASAGWGWSAYHPRSLSWVNDDRRSAKMWLEKKPGLQCAGTNTHTPTHTQTTTTKEAKNWEDYLFLMYDQTFKL